MTTKMTIQMTTMMEDTMKSVRSWLDDTWPRTAGVSCAVVLLSLGLPAQETQKPTPVHPHVPLGPRLDPQSGEEDPHEEIKRMFGKVENHLREIDRLLSDASAGEARSAAAGTEIEKAVSGIDKLLDSTKEKSQAAVEGIDRILELANHPHKPGGT